MGLAQELREQIRAYIERRSLSTDLRYWLADHVQDTFATEDPAAQELSDRAWMYLAELDYGHFSEEDLRAALAELVPVTDEPPKRTSAA